LNTVDNTFSKDKFSTKERPMSAKTASAKPGKFEMEVLNPRGKIEAVPASSPSPRISGINAKTIGLYSNSKPGMDNFYAVFEELLTKHYPGVKVKTMRGAFLIRDDDANTLASEVDAFIYGVGD
jgi:hypothetical protein